MEPRLSPISERAPGTIASLLKRSYATLLATDPAIWTPEVPGWEQFDRDAFAHPDTIGSCVFFTCLGDDAVGFASYDPRQRPAYGIVGHNCVLPAFRGRGLGKRQIQEVVRRLRAMGARQAKVTTNDDPFFVPAQRTYLACGFREVGRRPWSANPARANIDYELDLA